MSIQAMKQALEALIDNVVGKSGRAIKTHEAITALRAAIAEAERQEPVASIRVWHKGMDQHAELINWLDAMEFIQDGEYLLYTHPPQQEKVGPVAEVGTMQVGDKWYRTQGGYLMWEISPPAVPEQHFRYKFLDRAALDAWIATNTHPQPAIPAWQPIETPPKEWGSYLIWHPKYGMETLWFQLKDGGTNGRKAGNWYGEEGDDDYPCNARVTHWMPLPAAPKPENSHD